MLSVQTRDKIFRRRNLLIILTNITISTLSYVLALALRFDFDPSEILIKSRLFLPLVTLLALRTYCYYYWKMNSGFWRYVSTHDLTSLLKIHSLSSLLLVSLIALLKIPDFPRSVIFIEFILSMFFAGGARFAVRLFCEKYLTDNSIDNNQAQQEVLILGAGNSGHLLVKSIRSSASLKLRPVAVLDDNTISIGSHVHGVKVVGNLNSLSTKLQKYPNVSLVLVAIPTLSSHKLIEIEKICSNAGVMLKKIQTFEDIAITDTLFNTGSESPVIESLLEKDISVSHEEEIHSALKGKRILITGAGGSIGSELVRQILKFEPESLIAFDSSEFNIFNLRSEISDKELASKVKFKIGTIKDPLRLNLVFAETRPEIVFHAAAYKHVPLMEENPYEAFLNNIVGTSNLLQASKQNGIQRFVLISSDKAVAPTSIMGASKRIAEYLVKETYSSNANFQASIVRFGNVINSTGSVIPLFRSQLESGGPITITHPEMERFFMTTREAVRLVLTAGILGNHGEVYVLDMGKPIKILDIANKLKALYGRRDIPIIFTGMRPGEKLTEILSNENERLSPTIFDKVSVAKEVMAEGFLTSNWVSEIKSNLSDLSEEILGSLIISYANDERENSDRDSKIALQA